MVHPCIRMYWIMDSRFRIRAQPKFPARGSSFVDILSFSCFYFFEWKTMINNLHLLEFKWVICHYKSLLLNGYNDKAPYLSNSKSFLDTSKPRLNCKNAAAAVCASLQTARLTLCSEDSGYVIA